ncbi:glycosyltransferase family 4 protein [Roseibium sp. MMSF_3544]|uniref:glycosyltransferase family 4 protein n=1 Tax=unclassified Roseibium TaxID=2629323 RepID=UPI00273EE87D|nr:glycosyltransferase family 4 protein [Roseibium sp. MMSF_3544]
MKKLNFAYPGDIDTPTGGYGYDRKIITGLRDLGWQVDLVSLGEGFPLPDQATLDEAQKRLTRLPHGEALVIDGLAFGVMAEAAAVLADQLDLVALVHHPLCRETSLSPETAAALQESERKALSFTNHIIVTSHATATQVMDLFDVPEQDISVVLPGTEKPAMVDRAERESLRLLSVGTVVPRKGYDLLFSALETLKEYDWHLDVVGGTDADTGCYRLLQAQLADLVLTERVTFHGAVAPEELSGFYGNADVFVLASRYEGYGMAYTEALAHGLPVIGSGGGAVADTLPEGAAIYCGTEDVGKLRAALELLIQDNAKREEMAMAGARAASALPDWMDAATEFASALERTKK